MKIRDFIFFGCLMCVPTLVYGACSVANLTRCLDSACAINIGANPAARCQYCGSASAGTPTKSTTMRNISVGTSTKYIISDKELKNAPSDPGARYVWATEQCLKKVSGCTPDDVTDNYDKLIEQSCTAAGIATEFTNLAQQANEKKSQSSCSSEITTCIVDAKRCTADYRKCESDTEFDRYFSECSVLSVGCDEFLTKIRSSLTSARNTSIANATKLLQNIINSYKKTREQKLATVQASCTGGKAKQDCIARVCKNNMRNKCDIGFDYEKTVAEQLCKFYDTACERLK